MFQHPGVDPTRDHALLEVLDPGVRLQRSLQVLLAMTQLTEQTTDLVGDGPHKRETFGGIRPAEDEVMKSEQATQLRDGISVVIDPQIDRHVTAAPVASTRGDHQDRGALPTTRIATSAITGKQRIK
jgi:hypothetical protein